MPTLASDRFGAMELTPRHDEPLLMPGSTTLETMTAPCVVSVRVVAAVELRPMYKNIISNAMVDVALVHNDGSSQSPCTNTKMPTGVEASRGHMGTNVSSLSGGGLYHGQTTKVFRSKVVKSSLNPIWNFDVDFGDVDTTFVMGVLFTVRHVEKFGLIKRDIGQLMLSLRDIMDLKLVRGR